MPTLWLFEDQLSLELVRRHRPDRVLLIESAKHFSSLPFHKYRIAFQVAAMRHFAAEVRAAGFDVHHYPLSRKPYFDSVRALKHLIKATRDEAIIVVDPSEYHTDQWVRSLGLEIDFRRNTLFLTDRAVFANWAKPLKSPVMEHFYRRERKRLGVLMDGDSPVGGEWNLDKQNRKPAKGAGPFPRVPKFAPDAITRGAIDDVQSRFASQPGDLSTFELPVSRLDARAAFADFVEHRLPQFGDYEDAMLAREPVLNHSHVSMLLNSGLLDPMQMVREVESRFSASRVPLNSAEGFIRQIVGWREYVYGIYWTFMPEYRDRNARGSALALPDWFWTGLTDLNCLAQTLSGVVGRAYSHHIQRLMVISNFATLTALSPQAVNEWFYAMYVDSHDWVVTPNVIGMGMNADGGTMATKPYVSSAAYINRMSDYCKSCRYDPAKRTGDKACPYNYLYWTFLNHFADTFAKNPRMTMVLKNANAIDPAEMKEMMQHRKQFIDLQIKGKTTGQYSAGGR
jgi:deoxyribodipyrimidine photolyase-related protein